MILLIAITLSDYILLLSILVIIATAQYLVQPCRTKWLNIVDTLLLTDLTFLTGLLLIQDKGYAIDFLSEKAVFMYFLVLLPLLYIGIGVVSIISICAIKKTRDLCCKSVHHTKQLVIQQDNPDVVERDQLPIQHELLFSGEREPLLHIVQKDL